MSFPSSPSNNEIAIVNNIRYVYSSTKGTWTKLISTSTTSDQYARDTANSASSNTIVIQGVDTWQNTRIQAAFDKANTGGEYAIDNVARSTANTATNNITIIQGVDTWQNTRITAVDSFAQSAYDKANTGGAYGIDNVARLTANSASSNTIIIQGVDVWQNTRISAIEAYAQSAYSTANSGGGGGTVDQYARDVNVYQNTQISGAQTLAQAAFDAANTGGAGPTYQEKTYTYPGTIAISTGTARWWSQGNTTITRARAQVITAPSGSPVTIVIKKNGTSAQTFSISSGEYATQINTNITTVNGDYITIDLTSVGSAADLVISFLYTRTSV